MRIDLSSRAPVGQTSTQAPQLTQELSNSEPPRSGMMRVAAPRSVTCQVHCPCSSRQMRSQA